MLLNFHRKIKAARIFAILFRKATKIDQSKDMIDVIILFYHSKFFWIKFLNFAFFYFQKILQNLLDIISANRKDLKFKQALLPALGELIYFLSHQEDLLGKQIEHWSIPSLAYILIIRSIGVNYLNFILFSF